MHILEDPGVEPSHTVGLKLQTVELRLDYMGTSVLMGRVSTLDATLRDEWRISPQLEAVQQDATRRLVRREAGRFLWCDRTAKCHEGITMVGAVLVRNWRQKQ